MKFAQSSTFALNIILSVALAFAVVNRSIENIYFSTICFILFGTISFISHKKQLSGWLSGLFLLFYITILPSQKSGLLTLVGVTSIVAIFIFMSAVISSKFIHSAIKYAVSLIIGLYLYIQFIYYLKFGIGFDGSAIHAVMQSNADEGVEFLLNTFNEVDFFILIVLIAASFVFFKRYSVFKKNNIRTLILILTLSPFLYFLPITQQLITGHKTYQQELDEWNILKKSHREYPVNAVNSSPERAKKFIIVIGESTTKRHMNVYGYSRDTTPFLSQHNNLFLATDFISTHSHTIPSLSKMLSYQPSVQAGQPFTLLNTAKAAGFTTYWISNQRKLGAWDNLISIIASDADHEYFINHFIGVGSRTAKYDKDLLTYLRKILDDNIKEDELIFIHTMGSHVSYRKRYPEVDTFFPKNNPVDTYDNTIRYADSFLSEVFEIANSKNIDGVIYFSDHGEDVINKLGHNSASMTKAMVEIPFILWFSESYKIAYPEKILELKDVLEKPFMGDSITSIIHYLLDISIDGMILKPSQLVNDDRYLRDGRLKYIELPDHRINSNAK